MYIETTFIYVFILFLWTKYWKTCVGKMLPNKKADFLKVCWRVVTTLTLGFLWHNHTCMGVTGSTAVPPAYTLHPLLPPPSLSSPSLIFLLCVCLIGALKIHTNVKFTLVRQHVHIALLCQLHSAVPAISHPSHFPQSLPLLHRHVFYFYGVSPANSS